MQTLLLTLFIPPLRTDWDLLFQPLFDELLTPPPSVDHPTPEVIALIAEVVAPEPAASTSSPSSTIVDQDAPSPSNSQTTPETQSPIIPNDVEKKMHDLIDKLKKALYGLKQAPCADAASARAKYYTKHILSVLQLLEDRLVSWSSKRQKSVAISSTEAEYIALSTVVLKSFG
ncbi:hypothetical protein Tco_0173071 [Tanacetum coccineum]